MSEILSASANIFKGKLYGSVKEIFVNALKSENSSCLAMQIVSHDDNFFFLNIDRYGRNLRYVPAVFF